jgi:probable selenium-dependent hydroxylase accessory protein YqeC
MLQDGGVISLVGAGGKTSLMFRLARELAEGGDSVLTTTTTKIFEPTTDQAAHVILAQSLSKLKAQASGLLKDQRHICAAAARQPEQRKLGGFLPEIIDGIYNSRLFRWIIVEADGAAGRPLKVPAEHEPVIPACTTHVVGLVGLNGVGRPLNEQWVFRLRQFVEVTGLEPGAAVSEIAVTRLLLHANGIFKSSPLEAACIAFCNQADVSENFSAGRRIGEIMQKRKTTGLSRLVIGQTLLDPPILEVYDLNAKF